MSAPASFLGGKVLKWTLPAIEGRPGPDAPALKRLLLAQGELAQIYDADEGLRYLAVLELRSGSVRGNHYHKVKQEWDYVIAGELLLTVEDPASKERASISLRAGELAFVPTGIAHALRTVEPGWAVEFSPARFDAGDTYPTAVG